METGISIDGNKPVRIKPIQKRAGGKEANPETLTAPVVDLKRNSLDDGPGIRTVVFFKGCPLSCVWCQNPETRSFSEVLRYERDACLGCGACAEVCPSGAVKITGGLHYPVEREKCILCGGCVNTCPSGALSFVGREYTADDLLGKILKDEVFFRNTGGGVTLSGGEPTVYMDFVSELSAKLKARGIGVCLETCGVYKNECFRRELLPNLDLIYFDIKLIDQNRHEKYCGLSNEIILSNLNMLIEDAREKLLPRVPLIPGITTGRENLLGIRQFLADRGFYRIGLVPYNPLWLSKSESIGFEPVYKNEAWLSAEEKEEIRDIFRDFEFPGF